MVLRAIRVCEHSREGEEERARIVCHLVAVGNMTLWIHETGELTLTLSKRSLWALKVAKTDRQIDR